MKTKTQIEPTLESLTPLQSLVLEAFAAESDDRAQSRVTIAMFLEGQHHRTKRRIEAVRKVAGESLKDLISLGLVRVDSIGWHWLTDAGLALRFGQPIETPQTIPPEL